MVGSVAVLQEMIRPDDQSGYDGCKEMGHLGLGTFETSKTASAKVLFALVLV
jgi:hypothetical protein